MKRIKTSLVCLLAALGFSAGALASEGGRPWDKFPVERVTDMAALQNGAKLFVNYCLNYQPETWLARDGTVDVRSAALMRRDVSFMMAAPVWGGLERSLARDEGVVVTQMGDHCNLSPQRFVIPAKRSAEPEPMPVAVELGCPVQNFLPLPSAAAGVSHSLHLLCTPPSEAWFPDRLRRPG